MNSPTTRALLEDAFYQVLDNRIFRLLLVLVLALVAPAYLVGFKSTEVQVLYGWHSLAYADLFAFFGKSARNIGDVQGKAIQIYQSLIVENLGGTLGMVVCVSATAFFVPRMLEKGSADILFAKPVSRRTLLLSRYFAGLLFVGILSFVLIGGIYLGLVVVSGYNDPGFLWGAFTLIYLFGILHAFSTAIGVFTRSTVAAILLSILLFMGSGCVHGIWQVRQWAEETDLAKTMRTTMSSTDDGDSELPSIVDDAPKSAFVQFFIGLLDTLHYALPKTKDADALTRMLRKAVAGGPPALVDAIGNLAIHESPADFELASPTGRAADKDGIAVDLEAEPAVWVAKDDAGREVGRIELLRKSRLQDRPNGDASSAKRKPRKISTSEAADDVVKQIETSGRATTAPVTRKGSGDRVSKTYVDWTETIDGRPRDCRAAVFVFGDWLFEVRGWVDTDWAASTLRGRRVVTSGSYSDSNSPSGADRPGRFEAFVASLDLARTGGFKDPNEWYEERFGWTSELPYNAFLSIGTSLAFTLFMLWLARMKLDRIDF